VPQRPPPRPDEGAPVGALVATYVLLFNSGAGTVNFWRVRKCGFGAVELDRIGIQKHERNRNGQSSGAIRDEGKCS
jgi:hypothetical protein